MDDDEFTIIRITWTPADDEITQAAEMITFYAAYPSAAGDPAELNDFRVVAR
jgi:hypothetical protein